jgi:hypothetical protein
MPLGAADSTAPATSNCVGNRSGKMLLIAYGCKEFVVLDWRLIRHLVFEGVKHGEVNQLSQRTKNRVFSGTSLDFLV